MKRLLCVAGLLLCLTARAEDIRHPLTRAIDAHSSLLLLADLQPGNQQVLDMLTAVRAARQLVVARESADNQALQAAVPLFKLQAQSFAAGTPVDEGVDKGIVAYLATREQRRLKLLRDVDMYVRQVRRALEPEQVRLVDWTRPAEAGTQTDDQRTLEEMRQLLADLNDVGRLLDRIRYSITSDYTTTRVGRVAEFLRQYYQPNTREFNDAMDYMLRLTDEVRQVSENDWPQQASVYAGRVLQRVGALDAGQPEDDRAGYNWWDVYGLLVDVQTPDLLQNMLAAMGNPAGNQ